MIYIPFFIVILIDKKLRYKERYKERKEACQHPASGHYPPLHYPAATQHATPPAHHLHTPPRRTHTHARTRSKRARARTRTKYGRTGARRRGLGERHPSVTTPETTCDHKPCTSPLERAHTSTQRCTAASRFNGFTLGLYRLSKPSPMFHSTQVPA